MKRGVSLNPETEKSRGVLLIRHIFSRPRQLIIPSIALAVTIVVVSWNFPYHLPAWHVISIVTAWGGSGLLMTNLLLMVREPHVANLLGGLEPMYHWHHRLGVISYALILCHPLALAMKGWTESPHIAWQILSPGQQPWPVLLGWIALLLLMLGLTSTFALRLPYRLWRSLHFALGLAVLFSITHAYTLLGGSYLLVFIFIVASFALSWRFIASDFGVLAYPYKVTRVEQQTQNVIEARLAPCATALAMSPGQFILLAFRNGQNYRGCGEFHPFTVSGIESNGDLRVAIKALGPCTQHIQSLEPGVIAHVQGPFGIFMEDTPLKPQLWIAGGIGITPFMAALRSHPLVQDTILIYLFRNEEDAAFLDELAALEQSEPHFKLIKDASKGGQPDCKILLDAVQSVSEREVYICGPKPMLDSFLALLKQQSVSTDAIHFESFDFR